MSEQVFFDSFSPIVFGQAARRPGRRPLRARGELYMPEGDNGARSPGVVIIEGLGGVDDDRERAYGAMLARHGFATLVVDSFGSRGARKYMDEIRALLVTEAMMCADAFGALRYLRGHPGVDPERICILGFSYGGMISILTAYAQVRDLYASPDEAFAGHAAFYSASVIRLENPLTTGKPLLIMLGEKDDNVSVPRTREIADDLRRGGSEVCLDVLEGAYHQWNGADIEKQFVRATLKQARARLGRENVMQDEKGGWRLRNRLTRALLLLIRTNYTGYFIHRDDAATERSNERLLTFLRSATGG